MKIISSNKPIFKLILFAILLFCSGLIPSNPSKSETINSIISHEKHSLLLWELQYLPQKFFYSISEFIFPFENKKVSKNDPIEIIQNYIKINDQIRKHNNEYEYATIKGNDFKSNAEKEKIIQQYINELEQNQLITENALEEIVSNAIQEFKISILPNTVFPPVLISIEPPPSLLILSPRDQIKLEKTILLKSDNSIPQRYKIEDTIENLENKSVLISDIGGLSTFPATVKVRSLESTLSTTAHEWFHNYMIFKPLGRGYFNDDKLRTINETAANIFGDEIAKYILDIEKNAVLKNPITAEPCNKPDFCFGLEMNETRSTAEEYLNQGDISKAEKYMEDRQKLFLDEGYIIRKLNQAYFAFHGIYADSPSSKSTVFEELTYLRNQSKSLADFIKKIENISNENDYQKLIK